MRKLAQLLLWLFICSVPWGIEVSVPGIGTITRLLGVAAVGGGLLAVVAHGRIRKPGVIFWFAAVFAAAAFVSLLWTISYGSTAERVGTYIQLAALIWLVRELAPTREEQDSLRLAYCLGGLVLVVEVLRNYGAGLQFQDDVGRYTATGVNPNFVGFVLVIGFPMAWQLFVRHRGVGRVVSLIYCLVAPLTVLITGSRSAFLALLVVVSLVPLFVRRRSPFFWLKIAALLFGAAAMVELFVPQQSWDRLLTIRQELEGGTMSGRTRIWTVGVPMIFQRPVLGAGAGTFPAAVEPLFNAPRAAHNMPLSLGVEQGIVGLVLFGALLAACVWVIVGLPSPERRLWAASMVAWLVFAMSHDSHADRVTWVMFSLLAAQESMRTRRWKHSPGDVVGAGLPVGDAFVSSARAHHAASISVSH